MGVDFDWICRGGREYGRSVVLDGEKTEKTMLVTYMAVRDATGTYLGTMELVQDMGFAKEHFLSDVKAKEAALRAGMED